MHFQLSTFLWTQEFAKPGCFSSSKTSIQSSQKAIIYRHPTILTEISCSDSDWFGTFFSKYFCHLPPGRQVSRYSVSFEKKRDWLVIYTVICLIRIGQNRVRRYLPVGKPVLYVNYFQCQMRLTVSCPHTAFKSLTIVGYGGFAPSDNTINDYNMV